MRPATSVVSATVALIFFARAFVRGQEQEQHEKLMSGSRIRAVLYTAIVIIVITVVWGLAKTLQVEKRRNTAVRRFMLDALTSTNAPAGENEKPSGPIIAQRVPEGIINGHLKCRAELYQKFTPANAPPLIVADKAVESSEDYASSWQRQSSKIFPRHCSNLPNTAKTQLKAHLLRRAVATLPLFEAKKRELEAKALLYNRRMISEAQWLTYKSIFDDLCKDLKLILFDANAVEENFANRADGLISNAMKVLERQRERQKEMAMAQAVVAQAASVQTAKKLKIPTK